MTPNEQMTPNELAEKLDDVVPNCLYDVPILEQAADMLMKQQAEIDEWKYVIERLNSVIRQKEEEIEALKDEVAEWKMSYENCHRMCSGYGMN